MKQTILLFISLFFLFSGLFAKEYRIAKERITAKNGLSSNTINCIQQDQAGFLWIGTPEGLDRYDGYDLWNFTPSKENDPQLKGKGIASIHEDKANNLLWIFTDHHQAYCIDLETYRIIHHTTSQNREETYPYHHQGKLYLWLFGNGNSCQRIRYANKKFVTDEYKHRILQICPDEEGNDWILSDKGIYLNGFEKRLPESDSIQQIITYHGLCIGLSNRKINIYNHSRRMVRSTNLPEAFRENKEPLEITILEDNLLLFTEKRGYLYEIIDGRFSTPASLQIPHGKVINKSDRNTAYILDSKGVFYRLNGTKDVKKWHIIQNGKSQNEELWQAANLNSTTDVLTTYGNGLYLFDLLDGEFTHFHQDEANHLISNNFLKGFIRDQTGCLWVMEENIGLTKLYIDKLSSQRHHLQTASIPAETNLLTGIARNGEQTLCVTNKRNEVYTYDMQKMKSRLTLELQQTIQCITSDTHNRVWIGTSDGIWVNETAWKPFWPDSLPPMNIQAINPTDTGNTWIGLQNGSIVKTNFQTGSIPIFQLIATLSGPIQSITQDKQHRIWAASTHELQIFHPDSLEEALRFTSQEIALPIEKIVSMHPSPDGGIWIGTHGEGLFRGSLSGGNLNYLPISTIDGLISNNIQSISIDPRGNVWAATDEGLSLISCQSNEISNYHFPDNPLGNLYAPNASTFIDDILYLASNDGFVAIHTNNIPNPDLHPSVFVTSVKSGKQADYSCRQPLEFNYGKHQTTFQFSNLIYSNNQNVHYQYRLNGIDKEWSAPSNHHQAIYQSLPPGEYLFSVRRIYNQHHWGPETSCEITINRPWWSNWPAALICLFLSAILGTTFIRLWRIHHRLSQTTMLENGEGLNITPNDRSANDNITTEKTSAKDRNPIVSQREKRFIERIEWILEEEGCKADFTVIELSNRLGMGRTRLYTRMKEGTGMTPSEFLRQWRLKKAAKMLIETDFNIDEVREKCGFGNSTNFYNYFKKQYGMSPQKFRKSDGNGQVPE